MKTYSVLLSTLCISAAFAEALQQSLFRDSKQSKIKIVGGYPASRREFPYQASIHINGQHMCGASIVTDTWLVTAGHCILAPASQMIVYAGMLYQRENHPDVQASRVYTIIVHPYYRGGVAPYDIAIMQLSSRLTWTEAVRPVALPQDNQEFTGYAWVTGWGYTSPYNQIIPTQLQRLEMYIMPHSQCQNDLMSLMGTYRPLDQTMVCVRGPRTGSETVCQGDSGGPLVQNGILIGVTSWTLTPCGRYGSPSVYTKVSKHLGFIRQYVSDV